ncbi:thioesterase family protein [Phycicoccus sonneratiae]|uniref:Thioesterase n=1 Tax=Phycicoccus sonneratiae TaxID=2807628 RepID=A0ABS2CQF8_9MICO|nr:hotdog domain-containing protein [Phycicoccus sonneraticus]MBM6402053.1 thioesterase [Phycicoccus sonneraticus]
MDLHPGRSAEVIRTVSDADTAAALGSGDLPVLGTPRLLAWAEAATVAALAGALDEGATSVGTRVVLDHLAPSAVGSEVTVRAALAAVDGRRLALDVEATAADGTVLGRGTVERVVVDGARFTARHA